MITNNLPKVLVLDDDSVWLSQVPLILEDECQVEGYETIDQGIQAIQSHFYDILILDLNFVGDHRTGLDLFKHIHALDRGIDVIVISAETDKDKLIELFNAGVSQFISKPAQPNQIREKVQKVLERRALRLRAIQIASDGAGSQKGFELIGKSQPTQRLRADIARVRAAGSQDILLQGESGTGKELVARLIAQGDRSGRLVTLNCGAIADSLVESELFGHAKGAFTGADRDRVGAFEAAGGGFVFLDEIGEMPLNQQIKLLRVLQERKITRVGTTQEREVSFKVIAATHVNLEKAISEKKFRQDLFYRIQREIIYIPSLRERAEDIPEFVYAFIAKNPIHRKKTITQESLDLLQAYSWPGNVRELESIVARLCSRCENNVIREKDVCQVLPEVANIMSSRITKNLVGRYGTALIVGERKRFEKAIIQAKGDRTTAAEILGLSRATFFRKARDLGLVKERKSLEL